MTPTQQTPQPAPLLMEVEAEAFAVKNTPYLAMGIDAHRLLRLAYMEGWIGGQQQMVDEQIKRERAREWTEDHKGEGARVETDERREHEARVENLQL